MAESRQQGPAAAPPPEGGSPEERARAIWLAAKYGRSGSVKTARVYTTMITRWWAVMAAAGLPVAPPADLVEREAWSSAAAIVAEAWAGAGGVAPATFNQRLAIVASFYSFASRRGLLVMANPIARIDRRREARYVGVEALSERMLRQVLAELAGGDLVARRDRAVIGVAIETTRRLSELAALRGRDLRRNEDGTLTLFFARTKGGHPRRDRLSRALSAELLAYLAEVYGPELAGLEGEAAVWASRSRQNRGAPISKVTMAKIARLRLGVHFMALRHTGAQLLERSGARVSEIQHRLGHASLATTGRYLAALRSDENPYADTIAATLGFAAP